MSTRRRHAYGRDLSGLWWCTAIGGAAAVVAIAFLPVDSIQRSLVARGTGLAATVLFFVAFSKLPREVQRIWIWVGACLLITSVADVIYDYQALMLKVRPFPDFNDGLYIAAFVCAMVGIITLSRRLNPKTDVASWIDIAIVVIAVSAFVGSVVIGSLWTGIDGFGFAGVLDLLYPLMSIVLLAALIRLVILPHPRNLAIRFVAVSGTCFLICDLLFSNQLVAGRTPVVAMEVLWTTAMICLPLAAMSPGAALLLPVDAARANDVTTSRQVLICLSAVAVPAGVLLELTLTGTMTARWLLPVILALVSLVLLRLLLLMNTSHRQALTLAEMSRTDQLTGLPNKHTWDQLIQERASSLDRGAVCTIAMLDIDNFAQHQDSRVQQRGDLLLISASLAWLSELHSDDVLARCGADEFALLIRRDSVTEAQEVLRRVLRATPPELTISVGAALLRPGEDPRAAEGRAASALHAAMSDGRIPLDAEQNIPS